ncbi:hypothetical protein MUB15_32260 [Priestia sp. OVS21]|nr:hypothetical protein [Priestia sp. OVS21]
MNKEEFELAIKQLPNIRYEYFIKKLLTMKKFRVYITIVEKHRVSMVIF